VSILMIQGTTSDAGKSALVTGLCRLLSQKGFQVAPFKPQNMALNSAVTIDGGEIGRAQALQALAAGIQPHTDMNPVLLKPNSDTGSQVIIRGHSIGNMDARTYHDYKSEARKAVLESCARLQTQYDVVLVEGAGSPAEINLRQRDIANMGFAESVDCPVILIADIDRGGVFAHLVGTLELLSASEHQRVKGMVINRFRGDMSLLQSGIDWLENKTGIPVTGVLPYLNGLHLEGEDSLARINCEINKNKEVRPNSLNVIIPALPRLSNHTDFDPLNLHPDVNIRYIDASEEIPAADLIILPGSKSIHSDLIWLKTHGWDKAIKKHLRYGGKLIGICGGFQMLGKIIHDPHGIESDNQTTVALNLLDFGTVLAPEKQLGNVRGTLHLNGCEAVEVTGYEIHAGNSHGPALKKPLIQFNSHPQNNKSDGVISADNQIIGTYLHGLFESTDACKLLLEWAGLYYVEVDDYKQRRENDINRLAGAVEEALDMPSIYRLIGLCPILSRPAQSTELRP